MAAARLYLVCDACAQEWLPAALAGGVDVVQLRDKTLDDAALLAVAASMRDSCARAGALFILNDRPDLAAVAGADGVHVGQDDAPVAAARAAVGSGRLVGLSTHTPAQLEAVDGVDYIGVGPVYATPTKPGRPAVGLALVRHAATHARVPWFAIGGIDATTVGPVIAAGARRVAVVRAIAEAADRGAAAGALRAGLERAEGLRGAA